MDWANIGRERTWHSFWAREIWHHERNCRLPLAEFRYRNRYGMGSDLHLWMQAMCNAMAHKVRLLTRHDWIYHDQKACHHHGSGSLDTTTTTITTTSTLLSTHEEEESCMTCYFPNSEVVCPEEDGRPVVVVAAQSPSPSSSWMSSNNGTTRTWTTTRPTSTTERRKLYRGKGRIRNECKAFLWQQRRHSRGPWFEAASHTPTTTTNTTMMREFRIGAVEYLFTTVSPTVVQWAEHWLRHVVFPETHGVVPKNLITVHVRWGDKGREMPLVPIQSYIHACQEILERRRRRARWNDSNHDEREHESSVHIYLATTDPAAVEAMKNHMPSHWNLYLDPYLTQVLRWVVGNHSNSNNRSTDNHNNNHNNNHNTTAAHKEEYNGHARLAKESHGFSGLAALASLLIAMEANDFVLTTASNWSLLMNELRLAFLENEENDPKYSTTNTMMIDLRPPAPEY
ncbi:hypothetical protein ACA910_009528 [Epithemia clementina (nom. ined.)]